MKLISTKVKRIAIVATVALSFGYGVSQAFAPIFVPLPGCIQCAGCGPNGGIPMDVGQTFCVVCCVPPASLGTSE